jgi:hypothetical protein
LKVPISAALAGLSAIIGGGPPSIRFVVMALVGMVRNRSDGNVVDEAPAIVA